MHLALAGFARRPEAHTGGVDDPLDELVGVALVSLTLRRAHELSGAPLLLSTP